jgi:prepilin-type N-terminal cleavage/methylation domain-containing protein
MDQASTNNQRGLNLIEVMVASAIFLGTVGASTAFVHTTGDALSSGMTQSSLTTRANQLAERISEELMRAGLTTISPSDPAGGPVINYRRAMGYENGVATWGSPLRIEYRPAEDKLVWVRNPGLSSEQVVTWATGIRPYMEGEIENGVDDNGDGTVDERGVSFRIDNDVLTVSVSLEGRDPKGRIIVRSATATVRLRN